MAVTIVTLLQTVPTHQAFSPVPVGVDFMVMVLSVQVWLRTVKFT